MSSILTAPMPCGVAVGAIVEKITGGRGVAVGQLVGAGGGASAGNVAGGVLVGMGV